MLHLLFGRSGSGKTHFVRQELHRLAGQGEQKLMLLVPEQFSFESERAMLRLLGPRRAAEVEVVSFTRLADAAFRRFGGCCGKRLDDGGRSILMSLALEQTADHLPLYQKHTQTPELVSMMLTASAELKMCAVAPQELSRAAEQMEDGTLREKMKELSLILSAYEALVAQSYLDPQDDLTRLKEVLRAHRFFEGYTVFVDSFKSFTAQELGILELALCQAKEVTVALCADGPRQADAEMSLFTPVYQTARSLMRLARQNSVAVAAPVTLEPGVRFCGAGIRAVEEGAYRGRRIPLRGDTGDVALYAARSTYDEAAYVAMTIRRMVMEEGYRYRDFTILARSPEAYRSNLDAALERWDIPYFMDDPRAIDTEPLMRLVLCAFQAARSGYRSDDVFACLKTGLCGYTAEEISLIENYVFLWRLSGREWLETWSRHPRGFAGELTEQDAQQLSQINELRERIIAPLRQFADSVRMADGETSARAVYRFLLALEVPGHVKQMCRRMKEMGEPELADRQFRLWELLMQILDQMALVLKGRVLTAQRFGELLRLVIASGTIGSIPQGLDEVTVGAADRSRPADPKVVFLLGAVQGEFPRNPSPDGVFSDEERRALIQMGLPLNGTMEDSSMDERLMAYTVMAAPTERLFVTYPAADMDGAAKAPSSIVSEIRSILPDIPVQSRYLLPEESFANSEQPAFEMTARLWGQSSVLSSTLKELFSRREGYTERMAALRRVHERAPAAFENPVRARMLFEQMRHISATQIESYHLCRFQYFCRYGLGAKERRPAELNALEYGSLIHYLLEHLLREQGARALAALGPEELKQLILSCIERYVEEQLGGAEDKSPRFRFLVARIADSAQVVISHIAKELAQSKFQPAAFELELKEGGEFPPLKITLPNGETATVEGKIDRVDVMELDGVKYVRIIDYKTGKKEFRLSDVLYGVNLQMLIYLAALIQNGRFCPAGILYMPAVRPVISAAKGQSIEALTATVEKKLRMNGLLLDDSRVIQGMEEQAEGKYIPVALKDGKPAKTESIVNAPQLDGVMEYIKDLTGQMVQTLHGGDVAALPLTGEHNACQYCPYFAVCGHEDADGGRDCLRLDKAETLRQILKEETGKEGDENG